MKMKEHTEVKWSENDRKYFLKIRVFCDFGVSHEVDSNKLKMG